MDALLESLMRASTPPSRPGAMSELVGFLVVGGIGATLFVGLSMLTIGLGTGIEDWIVSAACYAVLVVPVYLLHRRFSFRSQSPHRVAFPRYLAVQLSAIVLAALFSFLCYRLLGLQTAVAAVLVTLLTAGVNFVVLKLWAFAQPH